MGVDAQYSGGADPTVDAADAIVPGAFVIGDWRRPGCLKARQCRNCGRKRRGLPIESPSSLPRQFGGSWQWRNAAPARSGRAVPCPLR
jgi:hypothetical protein